ncbi:ribose-5-phosphate isomerase RpiA [Gracilibacillus sp. S3-1-1]|uniref:Ribose-5-phosphate isomerase RpiA n=1 Tax=Gracilibacillus pellucidus TaxID=3095368 RepID=A0ACC6M347_9BACI|nr:ribose-5-phosphate isomerase RpiA [Gracilibacillus sp. S3-1-1]MDX8045367.1 ribose-5-phosphate isomerase RpiA [Gracilibacillus sp. S3-1-1]
MVSNAEQLKQIVAKEAVNYVKDGMKLGLGSGSTMYFFMKELGERVQDGLNVVGIPTSNKTAEWAKEFNVPLTDFSETQELDLAIDGADEVDLNLQLIKGGGGALLREKVVAASAKEFLVIVDESKIVDHLGTFPLPVEVVPFGWEVTAKEITALGCELERRTDNGQVYVTDNGNYILDCKFDKILDPEKLNKDLQSLVGVVENGLFINMTSKVLISDLEQVKVMEKEEVRGQFNYGSRTFN